MSRRDAVECDGSASAACDGDQQQAPADSPAGGDEREHGRHQLAYGLTSREMTVLRLLIDGASDGDIAARLGVSRYTASKHVSNILAKMGVESAEQAATRALDDGIFDAE